MKTQKTEIPEGYEIDKDKSTFEEIVFKKIEVKYPLSVNEIDRPYYISSMGNVGGVTMCPKSINHVSTEQRAEEILAFIQLLELKDECNRIDHGYNENYCIKNCGGTLELFNCGIISQPLTFNKESTAICFLETHKELLETAKNLI